MHTAIANYNPDNHERDKVRELIPDFLRENATNLITFLEEYYDYLNRENYASYELSHIIDENDIDLTSAKYLDAIQNEIAKTVQNSAVIDRNTLYKRIIHYYRIKGTPDSVSVFFQIMFDSLVDVYYPGDHLFKLSEGKYSGGTKLYGMWFDDDTHADYLTVPITGESNMTLEYDLFTTDNQFNLGWSSANEALADYIGVAEDNSLAGTLSDGVGTPVYHIDGVVADITDRNTMHDTYSIGKTVRVSVSQLDLTGWTGLLLPGRASSSEWNFTGVMRNAVLKNTSGTVVGQWNGYGNTNADWLDQGTGNVGMWFDNADDKVTIPKPAVTVDVKMKVTQAGSGVHGMTLASSNSDSIFLFASQSGSSAAISYGSGSPTFTVDGVAVTTRAELFTALADGLEHEVIATGADLSGWTSMYVGNYASDPPTTAWVWEGLIRDIRFYDSSTDALIHQYDGHGNTDANWKDQVGSKDGTVSGSPARAVATATGWRKANDGMVSGSPLRAFSADGGTTWAEGEGPAGSYSDERGFLSSTDKIHDGEFWQDFSYQIRTTIEESRWKDSYHRLVHPAGIRFFSLLLIDIVVKNRWEEFIKYEGTPENPEAWYDSLIPPRLRESNSYDASHTPRYQPGWLSSIVAIFIESLADGRSFDSPSGGAIVSSSTSIKARFQFEATNFRSKMLHDGYLTGEGRYNPLFWQDERQLCDLGYMDSTFHALTSNFNQHPLGTTPVNLSASGVYSEGPSVYDSPGPLQIEII